MKYLLFFVCTLTLFLYAAPLYAQSTNDCTFNQDGSIYCPGRDTGRDLALNASVDGWREAMLKFIYLINYIIVPILFAVGMIFFLWNVFRFAIASNNKIARDKAKAQMIYGIAGFVVLVSFWGIINIIGNSIGLRENNAPCNDFFTEYARLPSGDCQ